MTIYQLQKDMAEEIELVLADMVFRNPGGNQEHMRAYVQELPKRVQPVGLGSIMSEDEEEDPYPFCIVRTESGVVYSGSQTVRTVLVFGIFDDSLENLGHQALLNAIHKVTERFILDPTLKNMYRMNDQEGISWILDEEERYPYFIGGMTMSWNAYFVEREDRHV